MKDKKDIYPKKSPFVITRSKKGRAYIILWEPGEIRDRPMIMGIIDERSGRDVMGLFTAASRDGSFYFEAQDIVAKSLGYEGDGKGGGHLWSL